MRLLITGGCGFLGSNLAAAALAQGHALTLLDSLYRQGASRNLAWLQGLGQFHFEHSDIRNAHDVERVVREARPEAVFHLAGQVAMTTSLSDPRRDFEVNTLGGFNVLEAVRRFAADASVVFSSTNKVYGDLGGLVYEETPTRYVARDYPDGFNEALPLAFHSPYGCSKGAVDQYMLDYARMFGLNTVVFRHSSIFGTRQFSTYDQGWLGWFVSMALQTRAGTLTEPFTISGDGKQVRDVLYVTDLVRCYFAAVERIGTVRGNAFNIGGGMGNSLSLLELFALLEGQVGVKLDYRRLPWRQGDQRVFVSDNTKAGTLLGWTPSIPLEEGVRQAIDWMASHG